MRLQVCGLFKQEEGRSFEVEQEQDQGIHMTERVTKVQELMTENSC